MKTIIIKNSINELSNVELINLMYEIKISESIVKKIFVEIKNDNDSTMIKKSLYDEIINKLNNFSDDYKVEVMNYKELSELIYASYDFKNQLDYVKLIHYFSYSDLNVLFAPTQYIESLKFVVAYNDDVILGILKFAVYSYSGKPSISYCSVNKIYKSHGISKKILDKFFEFYSSVYKFETVTLSGYSVNGWKYLRNTILSLKDKYNVFINEKPIEYCGENGYSDDDYILLEESRKEIEKMYGKLPY